MMRITLCRVYAVRTAARCADGRPPTCRSSFLAGFHAMSAIVRSQTRAHASVRRLSSCPRWRSLLAINPSTAISSLGLSIVAAAAAALQRSLAALRRRGWKRKNGKLAQSGGWSRVWRIFPRKRRRGARLQLSSQTRFPAGAAADALLPALADGRAGTGQGYRGQWKSKHRLCLFE